MKLTIEIELSAREVRMLQDNSIERVHQTAVKLVQKSQPYRVEPEALYGWKEDQFIVVNDLQDFGPLASKLWNSARNAALIALAEEGK